MITTLEQLHTAWVDDDGGGDLIAILENPEGEDRPRRPLLGLPPLDALALAGQLISLARDALQAQTDVPVPARIEWVREPAELGPALRSARREVGFTQEKLAQKVGVGLATIAMHETGRRQPRIPMLLDVLQATGCELAVIRR